MGSAPWLMADAQAIAAQLLKSYREGFGTPLVAGLSADASAAQAAQALFSVDTVVLAHDGRPLDQGEGPLLIYANRAALTLWGRTWAEMVGMPSKLTAEPAERSSRQNALSAAQRQAVSSGYRGIRIDRYGRRFQIDNARLWTFQDPAGQACGQAACFGSWWWL